MKFVDSDGTQIQLGDRLVYAQSQGYSAQTRKCVVVGFTAQKIRVQPLDKQKYGTRKGEPEGLKIINPGRTVLVTNDERWPEVEEFNLNGWLPPV